MNAKHETPNDKPAVLNARLQSPSAPFFWVDKGAAREIRVLFDSNACACSALMVYFSLCEIASDLQRPSFRTTIAWIVMKSGLSRRTVITRLQELTETGFIHVAAAPTLGPSTYTILERKRQDGRSLLGAVEPCAPSLHENHPEDSVLGSSAEPTTRPDDLNAPQNAIAQMKDEVPPANDTQPGSETPKESSSRCSERFKAGHRAESRLSFFAPLVVPSDPPKNTTKGPNQNDKAPLVLDFPSNFSETFRKLFLEEWVPYRKGLRKAGSWPALFQRQLRALSAYGEAEATQRLMRAMTNGWTGFDFPLGSNIANPPAPAPKNYFSL